MAFRNYARPIVNFRFHWPEWGPVSILEPVIAFRPSRSGVGQGGQGPRQVETRWVRKGEAAANLSTESSPSGSRLVCHIGVVWPPEFSQYLRLATFKVDPFFPTQHHLSSYQLLSLNSWSNRFFLPISNPTLLSPPLRS